MVLWLIPVLKDEFLFPEIEFTSVAGGRSSEMQSLLFEAWNLRFVIFATDWQLNPED